MKKHALAKLTKEKILWSRMQKNVLVEQKKNQIAQQFIRESNDLINNFAFGKIMKQF